MVETIRVDVAYAKSERQSIISLTMPTGSTAEQAILVSGIFEQFPEINLDTQKIGIFGQICKRQQIIQSGDRIEIYRPLAQDPMSARRNRIRT